MSGALGWLTWFSPANAPDSIECVTAISLLVNLRGGGVADKFASFYAPPKTIRQIATDATIPAKSAISPAATAWRVRRIPTDPK